MYSGSDHVAPLSVERCSTTRGEPEPDALEGVSEYAATNVPLLPPVGVHPIPVIAPVPPPLAVKVGGPSALTVHVWPLSVERASSCGRLRNVLPVGVLVTENCAPMTASTVPPCAVMKGLPKKFIPIRPYDLPLIVVVTFEKVSRFTGEPKLEPPSVDVATSTSPSASLFGLAAVLVTVGNRWM